MRWVRGDREPLDLLGDVAMPLQALGALLGTETARTAPRRERVNRPAGGATCCRYHPPVSWYSATAARVKNKNNNRVTITLCGSPTHSGRLVSQTLDQGRHALRPASRFPSLISRLQSRHIAWIPRRQSPGRALLQKQLHALLQRLLLPQSPRLLLRQLPDESQWLSQQGRMPPSHKPWAS